LVLELKKHIQRTIKIELQLDEEEHV